MCVTGMHNGDKRGSLLDSSGWHISSLETTSLYEHGGFMQGCRSEEIIDNWLSWRARR